VVAILAIVRTILVFNPDPLYPLAAESDDIFAITWEQSYRTTMKEPVILIAGSSRIQRIAPSKFARDLNIDAQDISNLSRPANTFFDIQAFIHRNPDVLNQCELIIIDLLPLQLYENKYFTESDASFLRYATLEQKSRIDDFWTRLLSFGDTIFPFHSLRYRIDEWRIAFQYTDKQKLAYNKIRLDDAVSVLTEGPDEWGEDRKIHKVLNAEFPPADHLDVQAHALYEIFEAVSDGANVLMVRPPYRKDIENIILTNTRYRESNKQFKSFIDSIDEENVYTFWMESPEEYNLTDDDYNEDGAHLSPTGVRKFSQHLVTFIQEHGLLQP
jgi:uncharacterized protein YutD